MNICFVRLSPDWGRNDGLMLKETQVKITSMCDKMPAWELQNYKGKKKGGSFSDTLHGMAKGQNTKNYSCKVNYVKKTTKLLCH